ncbi:hypothetical protein Tco_0376021, partial [Tanacetum coccineum]
EKSFQRIYWGGHSIVSNNACSRQETEVPQPSSPTQIHVADEAASTGVDVRHGGADTTVSSLVVTLIRPLPCPMIHLS